MEGSNQSSASGPAPIAPVATLRAFAGGCATLVFSRDRSLLASAGGDSDGRLWDISGAPRERSRFGEGMTRINSLAISPNGRTLVAGSGTLDGRIKLLDITEKLPREIVTLRGPRGVVNAVAVSPDNKRVAAGGEDRTLRVWEAGPNFREDATNQLPGHTGTIRAIAFAADSQSAATASADASVRVWTLSRIRSSQRAVFPHPLEVKCLAWSPDGKLIATGDQAGIVRIWEAVAVKSTARYELPKSIANLRLLSFTPDSRTLVSASAATVQNWDPHTGQLLREWNLPAGDLSSVALTEDGRYLATGKADGVISIFRVAEKRS